MLVKSIVVFVHGCIRLDLEYYIQTIKNILDYLKSFETVDIVFHAWKSKRKRDEYLSEFVYDEQELERKLIVFPQIKKIFFEEQKSPEELDKLGIPFTQSAPRGSSAQHCRTGIYNTYSSTKTFLQFLNQSDKKYDYVLRCRNDLHMKLRKIDQIIENADKGAMCVPVNRWSPGYLNDHWVFALYDNFYNVFVDTSLAAISHHHNAENLMQYNLTRKGNPLYIFDYLSYNCRNYYIYKGNG